MYKLATTSTLNNEANVNIAMLDKTVDITEDNVIQIHDLSTTVQENLTPLYTDTTWAL